MTEKQKFYGVFIDGEESPRAVFAESTDASMYSFVRFGNDGLAHVCQLQDDAINKLSTKSVYKSLPFKEGVAFNKVMKMRRARREHKGWGGP